EWQRIDLRSKSDRTGYLARIKHLKKGGGFNGVGKLVWGKTVKDDNAADTLRGDPPHTAALDWFFVHLGHARKADTILDQDNAGTEQINCPGRLAPAPREGGAVAREGVNPRAEAGRPKVSLCHRRPPLRGAGRPG